MIFDRLEDVPLFAYDFVMVDPPWLFETYSAKGTKKSPQAHYSCMPLPEIRRLRVGDICKPDALLWLWATGPLIREAIDCMARWGFEYKTMGYWSKFNFETQKQHFGPGYRLRGAGEPFLIGTIGRPDTTPIRSSILAPLTGVHSQKPPKAYDEAEKMMPGAKRIELFSRLNRPGWDAMGDEAGKLDGVA